MKCFVGYKIRDQNLLKKKEKIKVSYYSVF